MSALPLQVLCVLCCIFHNAAATNLAATTSASTNSTSTATDANATRSTSTSSTSTSSTSSGTATITSTLTSSMSTTTTTGSSSASFTGTAITVPTSVTNDSTASAVLPSNETSNVSNESLGEQDGAQTIASICRDPADFAAEAIAAEWCDFRDQEPNASACIASGCKVHYDGDEQHKCECDRAGCAALGFQLKQLTCEQQLLPDEISLLLTRAEALGTCDGLNTTWGQELQSWVTWQAASCCKTSPATVCRPDITPAHPCRDADDFRPEAIADEWCDFKGYDPANCTAAGCHPYNESDEQRCFCDTEAKCAVFGFEVMQRSCGQLAVSEEAINRKAIAAEAGTCDKEQLKWFDNYSQKCCASFPASFCEKDAQVGHPCSDVDNFVPDNMSLPWSDFGGEIPNASTCEDAGCIALVSETGEHCFCDTRRKYLSFGNDAKVVELTCKEWGTSRTYREALMAIRANGSCAATQYGLGVVTLLHSQASRCCKGFPASSLCQKDMPVSTQVPTLATAETSSTSSTSTTTTGTNTKTFTTSSTSSTGTHTETFTTSSNSATTTYSTGTTTAMYVNASALPAAVIAAEIEKHEASVLEDVLSSQDLRSQKTIPGTKTVIIAQKVSSSALNAAGGRLSVATEESGTEVSVPTAVMDALDGGEGVLMVSTVDLDRGLPINQSSSMRSPMEVKAAVSINLASIADRSYVHVDGLQEPIFVTLPVNATDGVFCAFWDEELMDWSQKGLKKVGGNRTSPLVCSTTHLTLFAGIARGFTSTLECANMALLSKESFKAIVKGRWFLRLDACLLWAVLLLYIVLLVVALRMDRRHRAQLPWRDDDFLQVSLRRSATKKSQRSAAARAVTWSCCALRKEGLMELCGVAGHFLLNLCSAIFELLEVRREEEQREREGGCFRRLMSRLLAASLQQQTCAVLGLAPRDVRFLVEHRRYRAEQAKESAAEERWREPMRAWEAGDSRADLEDGIFKTSDSEIDASKLGHIDRLCESVAAELDHSYWRLSRPGARASLARALLRSQLPWNASIRPSIFMSASLRVLLLTCKTCGALMVVALFFETSRKGVAQHGCQDGEGGAGETIGECLAVGMAAVVLASIPERLLAMLHSRHFRSFDRNERKARRRQLRVWCCKDALLLGAAVVYMAFCILLVMAFLANVGEDDATGWLQTAGLELLSEFMLVPLATSTFLLAITVAAARWTEAVRDSAAHLGCSVAGEADRPSVPTAARGRAKAMMPALPKVSAAALRVYGVDSGSTVCDHPDAPRPHAELAQPPQKAPPALPDLESCVPHPAMAEQIPCEAPDAKGNVKVN